MINCPKHYQEIFKCCTDRCPRYMDDCDGIPKMKIDKRTTRHPDYHGEKNPNAKLNERHVCKIRTSYEKGWTPTELAKVFGVSKSNISNIVARRIWKHI